MPGHEEETQLFDIAWESKESTCTFPANMCSAMVEIRDIINNCNDALTRSGLCAISFSGDAGYQELVRITNNIVELNNYVKNVRADLGSAIDDPIFYAFNQKGKATELLSLIHMEDFQTQNTVNVGAIVALDGNITTTTKPTIGFSDFIGAGGEANPAGLATQTVCVQEFNDLFARAEEIDGESGNLTANGGKSPRELKYATQLDEFLKLLSFSDRTQIIAKLYNSDALYGSAYLQSITQNNNGQQNFSIDDIDYTDTARFEPPGFFGLLGHGNIKLDIDAYSVFPYSTFFHEWAHGIYQNSVTDSQKSDLQETIISDVTNNLTATAMTSYDAAIMQSDMDTSIKMAQICDTAEKTKSVQTVVEFILDPKNNEKNQSFRGDLSPIQSQTVDILQEYYLQELSGPENSMASDIYGGVTNNLIGGGHPFDYDKNTFYWYTNIPIGDIFLRNWDVLSNEYFAEGLSTMLAGPDEFKDSVNKFFPTAMPELNSILQTTVSK